MKRRALSTAAERSKFGNEHLAAGVGRMDKDMIMSRASGCRMELEDGRELLDFTSGIGVTNTGHCHPRVVEAVQKQASMLSHAQANLGMHSPMVDLMGKLLPLMPHPSLDTFFFWNSGAEAVEAAVKLARHATQKSNVIVMQGSYHGRTFQTMAMTTSKTIYSAGYAPLPSGIFVSPFAYCQHCRCTRPAPVPPSVQNFSDGSFECCGEPLEALRLLLKQQTHPNDTAAIILEPVLGEGGYVVPPPGFIAGVKEICEENNILLIADEVQTGFGRTGEWFAIQHWDGVVPDIMIMAKGMASGYPLSAIVSRKELMDSQPPGSMGGTYAGNAVSCAAACATIDVFQDEDLLGNTKARGRQLIEGLHQIQARLPSGTIKDVRGLGLMVATELGVPAAPVSQACLDGGMMLLTTSVFETLRFIPPLTVSEEEIQRGLGIFEAALRQNAPVC